MSKDFTNASWFWNDTLRFATLRMEKGSGYKETILLRRYLCVWKRTYYSFFIYLSACSFSCKMLRYQRRGATERTIKKQIFFLVDFRGAQGSNRERSSCSDGTSDWLWGHVKQLWRELHLIVADLRMIYCLPGRSRDQHLVWSVTSHTLGRATSDAISHSSSLKQQKNNIAQHLKWDLLV